MAAARRKTITTIYRLYHSPIWWEHRHATRGAGALRLLIIHESDGRISAIVPCELRRHRITRRVAGHHLFALGQSQGFDLLASEPLADNRPEVFDAVIRGMWQAFPGIDICRLKSLSTTTPFWRFLNGPELKSTPALVVNDGDFQEVQHSPAARVGGLSDPFQLQAAKRPAAEAAAPVEECWQPRHISAPDGDRRRRRAVRRYGARGRTGSLPAGPEAAERAPACWTRRSVACSDGSVLYGGNVPLAYIVGYQAF